MKKRIGEARNATTCNMCQCEHHIFTKYSCNPFPSDLHSSESQSSLNILGHPEGHPLGHPQALPLLETDVVVHVDHLTSGELHQEVVKVTVTKTDDVTNHAHDCSGAGVRLSCGPPL